MEKEILLPYIKENISRSQYENVPAAVSKFLDSASLSLASALSRRTQGRFAFWGGFENAERVIMVYLPDYIDESLTLNEIFSVYCDCFPIAAVRLKKDKFSSVSHRDYLGAVMGLGLTRDTIGDILVHDDGCDIIALPHSAKYINEHLISAGRATVKTELIPLSGVIPPKIETQEIAFTVASPRIDAVVGEIFSLSRSSAQQAVSQGIIFLNDEEVTKSDKKVNPCDKIVLRGKGRAIIGEDFYTTKKGRIRISALKSI